MKVLLKEAPVSDKNILNWTPFLTNLVTPPPPSKPRQKIRNFISPLPLNKLKLAFGLLPIEG